ncbi:F-box domain-containing protein [Pleurostoma richardsiae]|uniref:F-box domain-containing protein n=1 Tax=Pleurostoma richardsiae TaxID=41990 RepID=A0AA38VS51_9PEZI|nr:F-box domain-containing protein [Pleurostoma richardsiae]
MASDPIPEVPSLSAALPRRPLTFLDLPRETQKEIFSHCFQNDLISLALVSKHFRDLAASQLYRNFHIVFPDDGDIAFDTPLDGLAGGLDTFVTSDYDYAQHLRDLSLDTLSGGEAAELAYKPYLYSLSCGKFLNTLLQMTLRRAKALDTFRWNIRVELSRPVYQTLHGIDTLKHVHIRMQSGPSLYETPPRLPLAASPGLALPTSLTPHISDLMPPPPPAPAFLMPTQPSVFYLTPPSAPPPPAMPKPRLKTLKKWPTTKEPPTLSGFKKLRSLAVLDIDSLDIITELKSCVRNSSGTLTKLKLSFSDALGHQARKPPPDIDPDDSEIDDEFQAIPLPPTDDASAPAKAFRAQEERKSQEAVLGRIFDVQPYVVKKVVRRPLVDKGKSAIEVPPLSPSEEFVNGLKRVATLLMKGTAGTTDVTTGQQEVLDTIVEAARKYVASVEGKPKSEKDQPNGAVSSSSTTDVGNGAQSTQETQQPGSSSPVQEIDYTIKEEDEEANPDNIRIEEPDGQLTLDSTTGSGRETPESSVATELSSSKQSPQLTNGTPASGPVVSSSNVGKAVANLAAQRINFKSLTEKLVFYEVQANELNKEIQQLRLDNDYSKSSLDRITAADRQMREFAGSIQEIQKEILVVEAEIRDAEKQMPLESNSDDAEARGRRITEYVRSTRGIALETLSLYLIPVKVSVLYRAIDVRALKRITLLNVGSQAPLWTMLAKENRVKPLPLRKIFTDNVSLAFLTCVSQLEEVHELFMLERDLKYKPESFAPRTTTTIDQIRRLVLKKHIGTLQRLMIKNQADQTWDVDEKAVLLLCRHGKALEELAVSMNIRAIHTLLQRISGLVNLRALHIINLRNDDTCVWVMRETRRFLVDTLSHAPDMKLQWISIDDGDKVDRVVQCGSDGEKKPKAKAKAKGKGKAGTGTGGPPAGGGGGNSTYPMLSLNGWDPDASDSSDDDGDGDDQALKFDLEQCRFYDTWGIKIFKKEVVCGKL